MVLLHTHGPWHWAYHILGAYKIFVELINEFFSLNPYSNTKAEHNDSLLTKEYREV
jgi:hypothetical protein